MPWALVELDANQRDGAVPPIQLQFLGRQRFTQSRKPIRPRGFTPRGDARPARQERGEHPNAAPPREALRQSEASQNLLQAVHAAQAPPLPPHPHSAAHVADAERCEPSHRAARVLPVKRQPSPRINIRTIPALVLTGMEERGGGIRSARFTPRSQAQEDAKAAHRRSIANGAMKKLMDKNWAARKVAVEALAEAALIENDSTVIDAIVQHLASRNDKARQAAIFAISRISSFQGSPIIARHFLRLLEHPNPEVRQAAQAALGHVITKGEQAAQMLMDDIEVLVRHNDRHVREAAVDAVVQVSEKGDKRALECLATCFADADRMVRQVALEASEQLLDKSLTSVLLVLGVLRNVCEGPTHLSVKSRIFASSSSAESMQACRALVSQISIPPTICCPSCASASRRSQSRDADAIPFGPFQQETLCAKCVSVIFEYVTRRELPEHFLAFCMGGHARLGQGSLVGRLDVQLLPVILSFCWPNSAVPLEV